MEYIEVIPKSALDNLNKAIQSLEVICAEEEKIKQLGINISIKIALGT